MFSLIQLDQLIRIGFRRAEQDVMIRWISCIRKQTIELNVAAVVAKTVSATSLCFYDPAEVYNYV
jgi:hypothetical protein